MANADAALAVAPRYADKSATIAAINSTFALASVGIAAVRTMESVLPSAANDVEKASHNLTERFLILMQNIAEQNSLMREIMSLLPHPPAAEKKWRELEARMEKSTDGIDNAVSGIIVNMQFQDRNTQMMENAARILNGYGLMLEEVRNNIEVARGSDTDVGNHITQAIENILSGIRIGEMRRQFMESLDKAEILYHSGENPAEDASEDQGSIELF